MLLHEKLKPYRVILASRSPRRRQLLADSGIEYVQAPDYEIEEIYPSGMPPEEVPLYLSLLKSDSYPHPLAAGDILLTADTVVIVGNEIIGKPEGRDAAEKRLAAIETLRKLSGRSHRVITGVTIRSGGGSNSSGSNGKRVSFSASSDVWFRALSDEEIIYYVDNYAPYDKAGAYGIQEWVGYVGIERIEGSFYNVMGLPVQRLYVELGDFIG